MAIHSGQLSYYEHYGRHKLETYTKFPRATPDLQLAAAAVAGTARLRYLLRLWATVRATVTATLPSISIYCLIRKH